MTGHIEEGPEDDDGACDLCGEPFADGERVIQVVEDKHPTYDKEIVLNTYHARCCQNREEVRHDCPHCGCTFHLALLRRGDEYQNLAHQLFCPFCATLFDCDMGFGDPKEVSEPSPPLPQALSEESEAVRCPHCRAEVEIHPDQDGSCDYYCTRCTWHDHVPGERQLVEVSGTGSLGAIAAGLAAAGLKVDRELLERQAAFLGQVVDGTPLTDHERTCLGGLWEFVHRILDSLEARSGPEKSK